MSRLKKAKQAGVTYQGASPGGRFQPVQATNSNRALREWKEAREADARTIGRELSRQQKAETTALGLQQTADRAGQQRTQFGEKASLAQLQLFDKQQLQDRQLVDKSTLALEGAGLQAKHTVDSAKLDFLSTSVKGLLSLSETYAGVLKQKEEWDYKSLVNKQKANAVGLGDDWMSKDYIPSTEVKDGIKLSNTLQTAETKTLSKEAEKLENSDDPTDIHTATSLKQGTIWQQTAAIRGNVFSARALLPAALEEAITNGVITAGPQGFAQAADFLNRFAHATGILDADERLVREHFLPTAENLISTQLTAITKKQAEDIKTSNQITIDNNISNLTDSATTADIGAIFDKATLETINGNGTGQWGGKHSTGSTAETLTKVLDNLIEDGKFEVVESLSNHVPNKSTGLTLGKQYDHIFDPKIKAARKQSIENHRIKKGELQVKVETTRKAWFDNPTDETRAAYIEALGNSGTKENLQKLNDILQKPNYNPRLFTELLKSKNEGKWKSESFYKSLFESGSITAEEFKALSSETGLVGRSLTKTRTYLKNFDIKARLVAANPTVAKSSEGVLQIETRAKLLQTKLSDLIEAEVRANPKIAQDDALFTGLVESKLKSLQSDPIFNIDISSDNLSVGAGILATDEQLKQINLITDGSGHQDFTKAKSYQSIFKTYPFSVMDPSKDKFLTPKEFAVEISNIARGKEFSKKTLFLSKKLHLSPKAFVEAQSSALNTGSVDTLLKEYYKDTSPSEIKQDNKVDLNQVKTVSPEAYRIATNPNSNKADLRRASYLYFGYNSNLGF